MSVLMVPRVPPLPGCWHDQLRLALGSCAYPPGATGPARFAADMAAMALDKISPGQWAYMLRLAYRMRDQMPDWLVPPKGLLPPPRSRPAGRSERSERSERSPPARRRAPPQELLPLW